MSAQPPIPGMPVAVGPICAPLPIPAVSKRINVANYSTSAPLGAWLECHLERDASATVGLPSLAEPASGVVSGPEPDYVGGAECRGNRDAGHPCERRAESRGPAAFSGNGCVRIS